jgi:hypothetical protein
MKKVIAVFLLLVLVAPPAYCADKKYVDGYPRTVANENGHTVLTCPT